jgi:hypothetical protein
LDCRGPSTRGAQAVFRDLAVDQRAIGALITQDAATSAPLPRLSMQPCGPLNRACGQQFSACCASRGALQSEVWMSLLGIYTLQRSNAAWFTFRFCRNFGATGSCIRPACYWHPSKSRELPWLLVSHRPLADPRRRRCCTADTLLASLSNVSNSRLTTKPRGALPPRLTPTLSDLLRKWRPVVIGPGAAPSRQASGPTTIPRNQGGSAARPAIGTIVAIAPHPP